MKFTKRKLTDADQGYSVASMELLGQHVVLAAAEGTGPGQVFPLPDLNPAVISEEPGGCMGFAPVPGHPDAVLMITKFYPIFKSEEAGINLYTAVDGFKKPWSGRRVVDMPFVHRICTVLAGGQPVLIGASVCGGKDFQDDWSRPGTVYAIPIPADLDGEWKPRPILPDIHINHGMNLGVHNGGQSVFISGTEGIFAIAVPDNLQASWDVTPILASPVSEVYPYDLDGDGEDELAVIEPFHGDTVAVYKRSGATWDKVFSAGLGFGHGLWAGTLAGNRCIIVGNRAGSKNLCCYRARGADLAGMEEIVVDAGSGTTNMDVVSADGVQKLIASNPEHGEYAIYDVTDGAKE